MMLTSTFFLFHLGEGGGGYWSQYVCVCPKVKEIGSFFGFK